MISKFKAIGWFWILFDPGREFYKAWPLLRLARVLNKKMRSEANFTKPKCL